MIIRSEMGRMELVTLTLCLYCFELVDSDYCDDVMALAVLNEWEEF